jgi:hypothetical protein
VSEKTSENAAIDVVYVVLPFQCRIWATSSSRFLEKSGLQPEEGIAKDRLRYNLNDLRFTNGDLQWILTLGDLMISPF